MKANEELAAYAHEAWSRWMQHLLDQCVVEEDGLKIPYPVVDRWRRQMQTPYAALPESEKESDRAEALKIQAIYIGDPSD